MFEPGKITFQLSINLHFYFFSWYYLTQKEGEHCGYVYKTFNCKDLILNYQPSTLEELKKFFPHIETDKIIEQN